jgi:O-antigen ligase
LRTDSPTGSASETHAHAIRGALSAQLPSFDRRFRAKAAAVAASLVTVAVVGGAAAAGLGLLAVVALVTAFQRPYLLGPLVVLLLPAGERVDVLGAQVAPLEAVVGGGAIGYLLLVGTRREGVRIRAADWVFALLLVFIALSTLGPVDDTDRLRELLFWGALGIVFHVVTAHVDSRRDLGLLLAALAASTLVEASFALFEYVDAWSERFSLVNGAIVYPLPQGTLGHPNALAQFLVLAVLAVLALALADEGVLRRLGFVAAGAGSLALVVTFSRASWIALAVGASVYLVERRTRMPVLAAGAVAAFGAAALALLGTGAIGARISSLFHGEAGELYDFRLELIRRGAQVAADHPLTGSGHFEEVGVYAGRPDLATHPHNLFVGLAVFFGIPAALAFAGLVLVALRAAWKGFRARAGADRFTAVGFLALFVALLVNGLFEYPFWNTSLTVLIVVAIALAVTLERDAPQSSGPRNKAGRTRVRCMP